MRSMLLCFCLLAGCSTAPREAAPLDVERVPKTTPREPPTIHRAVLEDVISRGPGRFLARTPVEPHRVGRRLVGYRLLALYSNSPPHPEGLQVGDVVTAVNELPISTPDQFFAAWQKIGKARSLEFDVIRGDRPLRIAYRIID